MGVNKSKTFSKVKNLIGDYKERLLELLATLIEEESRNLGNWLKNITHLKQKIRRAIVALALLIGGITVVLVGLGQYIAETVQLPHYLGYIMIGFIGIIASLIYYKL